MSARNQFGRYLRALRRERQLTQRELADAFGYSEQHIRHIEAGRKTPSRDLGERADRWFGVPGGLMAGLGADARNDTTPFGELKEYEQAATRIRWWENRFVPGLLQTEDYAWAVLGNEAGVLDRMERQAVLERITLRAVVDECVLSHQVGTAGRFAEQLQRLIDWRVRVVPAFGWHAGMDGPFTVLEFASGPSVVWVDGRGTGTIMDADASVKTIMDQWDETLGRALPVDISAEMIAATIDDLPKEG